VTFKTDYNNTNDVWMLCENLLHPENTRLSETLFSQGNGFIGVRGTLEEGWSEVSSATFEGIYLNGQSVQEPVTHCESPIGTATAFEQLLHVPNVKKLDISIGNNEKIISHERQLDCRTGILSRQKLLELPNQQQCLVEFERFVSAANPHLMCIRVECLALSDNVMLEIKTGCDDSYEINTSVSRLKGQTYTIKNMLGLLSAEQNDDYARFIHEIKHESTKLATTCIDTINVPGSPGSAGNGRNSGLDCQPSYINVPKYVRLSAGKSLIFYRYALFHVHENDKAVRQLSQTSVNNLLDVSYAALKRQHCEVMNRFWQGAEQQVALSDPHASLMQQQGLNFGMLQLFQTTGRGFKAGLPVRGMSGPAGDGHMSWESDIHGVSCLAITAPELARGMLLARYHQLPDARARAVELSYEHGAFYPCLTISGDESDWNALRSSTQLHVNGALAYAIQQYFRATNDMGFLRDYGAEMLVETARLWQQSGYFNEIAGGKFCIDGVSAPNAHGVSEVGVSEAHGEEILHDSVGEVAFKGNSTLVNNHFYTNFLAREHLRFAIEAMALLQAHSRTAYAKLCLALKFDAYELANWQVIADKMYLSTNAELGIHLPYDGVAAVSHAQIHKEPFHYEPMRKEPIHHELLHKEPLHQEQKLSQADVLLAMVLADNQYDADQKQRNLDYYLALTDHNAELSRLICCILLCELGRVDEAKTFFGRSARTDLNNRLEQSDEGLHCLTMAGTRNAIIYGFLGVRLRSTGLVVQPQLPSGWDRITQHLHFQQRIIRINVTAEQVDITLLQGEPLTISLYGKPLYLTQDKASQVNAPEALEDPQY